MIRAALAALAIAILATGARAQSGTQAPGWFSALDADASGTITLAEMHAARFERFRRTDADGDGFLSRDEIGDSADWQKWFDWYDANKDGRIPLAEFEAKGQERFRLMDGNGDGGVTLGEIQNLARQGGR